MSGHTPGRWAVKPWVEKDADGAIENTGLQVVSVVGSTETGIFSSCDEGREDREEADLYLIAAAPDLLEALQELICIAGVLAPTCMGDEGQKENCLDRAIAAVEKAAGKRWKT